jgi:hypothetical protein
LIDPAGGITTVIDPDLERLRREVTPPPIAQDAGPGAEYPYADFFKARIGNPNTRKAYQRAVDRSLHWCRGKNVAFRDIPSFLIADYLEHHLND